MNNDYYGCIQYSLLLEEVWADNKNIEDIRNEQKFIRSVIKDQITYNDFYKLVKQNKNTMSHRFIEIMKNCDQFR